MCECACGRRCLLQGREKKQHKKGLLKMSSLSSKAILIKGCFQLQAVIRGQLYWTNKHNISSGVHVSRSQEKNYQ